MCTVSMDAICNVFREEDIIHSDKLFPNPPRVHGRYHRSIESVELQQCQLSNSQKVRSAAPKVRAARPAARGPGASFKSCQSFRGRPNVGGSRVTEPEEGRAESGKSLKNQKKSSKIVPKSIPVRSLLISAELYFVQHYNEHACFLKV